MLKKFALVLCALCLLLALTGCERADYVAAVEVYNSGDFAQARELFLALEDYENSPALVKRCDYHLAVDIYREGRFEDAIAALEKLGDYEDCPQLITHSKYQIALKLKEDKAYDEAEAAFEALEGYENSADHIMDIRWSRLLDTLLTNSVAQEDGTHCIEGEGVKLLLDPNDPHAFTFTTEYQREDGFVLRDGLSLTLRYRSQDVQYSAFSKYIFTFMGKEYGNTQICSGTIAAAELTRDTQLALSNYQKTSLDVKNKEHLSTDPTGQTMDAGIAENLPKLLDAIPTMLLEQDERFTAELLGHPLFG